jgi:AbiJ N-terminal domain 4
MTLQQSFSSRHHYSSGAKEITIREDASGDLRYFVLDTARQLNLSPKILRPVLCRVLRRKPNEDNWSEYPNIWDEVQQLIYGCEWFRVYDVIEALYVRIAGNDEAFGREHAPQFGAAINRFFIEEGIGWQLVNGEIVIRGDEAFETVVTGAQTRLQESGRLTAAKHIKDALECLSRRPEPNASGAVYHAMGSLECVARDVTDDPKATLGQILKRYPTLLPKPLDAALSQIWGYASEEARHVQEGREIDRQEAELLVGLSATLTTYLSGKANI